MASIVSKNKTNYVVYYYTDTEGKVKQKWERYDSKSAADRRCKEIDYKKTLGELIVPECKTMAELLHEFVESHGKERWSLSTYERNVAMINRYIIPYIGKMKITDVSTRVIETYYRKLEALPMTSNPRVPNHVSPSIIRDVHKILRSSFKMAVKWELLERNPAIYAEPPVRYKPKERDIWTAEELFHAIDICDNERLKLCMNLSFACTLRIGEILGLTWDCVDVSEEAIESDSANIYINKQIQRVSKKALEELDGKGVIRSFHPEKEHTSTVLVMKTPKTESSIRKVFLPRSVANMLIEWKRKQDELRDILGDEFEDNNLVICTDFGNPVDENRIKRDFDLMIKKNNLRKVVFHSLRHTSITYKLKLNGGDVKAVQGDSGHAQTSMVTDVYSHILDEGRRKNAQEIEAAFYSRGAALDAEKKPETGNADMEAGIKALAILMKNKELMAAVQQMKK